MLGFFISAAQSYAYSVVTHAYLTKEVIEFYNRHFENKIPEEFWNYVIDGARKEDEFPRYWHHFYDPVYDRGLTSILYGNGYKSKEWAQNEKLQNKLVYRTTATIASLLSAVEQKNLGNFTTRSNYTWDEAIDLYARGEKEKAFYALGHILHLIEDTSVPDHTRNDPHPPIEDGGSPYENWTEQFTLENADADLKSRLFRKKPVILQDLNAYFDSIANYSNKNFYSQNTLGIGEYKTPELDYTGIVGEDYFGFKKSDDGDYYLVAYKSKPGNYSYAMVPENNLTLKNEQVLNDYWSRLSVKAVQHAAGVIDLFLKEAAKAQPKKSFLGQLIDAVKNLFSRGRDGGGEELIAEIPLEVPASLNQSEIEDEIRNVKKVESISPVATQLAPTLSKLESESVLEPEPELESASTPEPTICLFETGNSPTHQGVIINEVAWMGSPQSSNDEWIELKNITDVEADVSGWQIIDKDSQIKALLSGKIAAGAFYLLERTDDNSAPGVSADQIYAGALANVGEGLRLFDKNCGLIDEVWAAPDWPAGDNTYKLTMERQADFSWRHSANAGGTPKAANSQGVIPAADAGSATSFSSVPSSNSSNNNPPDNTQQNQTTQSVNHLLISEVQVAGIDAGDEFIELYNPTDAEIDLSGWSIQYLSGSASSTDSVAKKNFAAGHRIPAKGFFLIARGLNSSGEDGYRGTQAADMSHRTFSLSAAATGGKIFLVNNQEKISGFSDENIIDQLDYAFSVPATGQSLERKASVAGSCATAQGSGEYLGNGCDTDSNTDFDTRSSPNPQNSQSLPEPREAPLAVKDFRAEFDPDQLSVNFSWAHDEAQNARYNLYSDLFSTNIASTSFSYPIFYVGRKYNFRIHAVDRDGLESEARTTEVNVPGIVNLSFYQDPRSVGDYVLDLSKSTSTPWQMSLFYLNRRPPEQQFLTSETGFRPDDQDRLVKLKYQNCFGVERTHWGLQLPISEERCLNNGDGGLDNDALHTKFLEDNRFYLKIVLDNAPGEEDYIQTALYRYDRTERGVDYFKLAAVDETHYKLQASPAVQEPPQIDGSLTAAFDKSQSKLSVSWLAAADDDSWDGFITYEINYATTGEFYRDSWQSVAGAVGHSRAVADGDRFFIGVRACDDFGNCSEPKTTEWSYPQLQYFISQTQNDRWSSAWGDKSQNCSGCPPTASLQSIMPAEDFTFNIIVLKIQQAQGGDPAKLLLSVYEDNGADMPDWSKNLGTTELGWLANPDPEKELTFSFASPINFVKDKKYWLVLSATYGDGRWFYSNSWKNALAENNPYQNGYAGKGHSGSCGEENPNHCSFRIPFPDADTDWYMKIGLDQ